jgi:hypothetical protein
MGNEKAGWGLYILPEDIAKIGQMVLDGGRFEGRQIVPEEWIKEATRSQTVTPKTLGDYDYGYQIWVGRNERSFLFNGMFGQNVLGFFDTDVLLVSNAGNNELFQQSSYYALATKHFSREEAFSESKPKLGVGLGALQNAKKRLCADLYTPPIELFGDLFAQRGKLDIGAICKRLDGRHILPRETNALPRSAFNPSMRRRCRTTLPRACTRSRLSAETVRCRSSLTKRTNGTCSRSASTRLRTTILPRTGKSTASASAGGSARTKAEDRFCCSAFRSWKLPTPAHQDPFLRRQDRDRMVGIARKRVSHRRAHLRQGTEFAAFGHPRTLGRRAAALPHHPHP